MTIRLSCPSCGTVASVEEQSLGRRGRCKKCGHVFALARPGGDAASAISGDASAWKGSAPASPINLPEQFGRYRIMKQLGQGGMGAVYLAQDIKLDRRVALKVPFFHPAEGPQAIQRFEREARAAATLDHPNLCPIHDVGEIDGIHYLTMPYIEGKTLSEAITRDQAFTEAQAATVVRKLALALQEAHAQGVIHRDLKPGNIMVNRRRELVIMDFGLARMVGAEGEALTRTGHVLGTALYMAPEQAAGDIAATGPACDVYSLGVILYELLTGRRPFEGPWSLVIGLKNVKDPEPPSIYRSDLSPALDAICLKAIAQKPENRYATMAEFAKALGAFLARAPGHVLTAMPSNQSPPARKAESLAAQVFEGIVSREATSLREEKTPARTIPKRPKASSSKEGPPRFSGRFRIIAAAGGVLALLLGVIIYVVTEKGRIKIEVNDPNAVVKIDGKEVRIEGLGEPITLTPGEHDYLVKWGNGEFKTDRFVVHRGNNDALKIEYEPQGEVPVEKPREQPKIAEVQTPVLATGTESFRPLFNGKDLTGWVTPDNKDLFTVENGEIVGKSVGQLLKNEFLVTDKPYADFILKASVKLLSGNSGIQFRSKRSGDGTVSGLQADFGKSDWGQLYEERGRGILDSVPERKAAMLVHEGDWNDFVITAKEGHVTISLNGRVVNERDDANFDRSGIIALQVHGGFPTEVRFREIEIKELPRGVTGSPPTREVDRPQITNTLDMRLTLIPAGEFPMGSDDADADAGPMEKANGKKHRVRITKPFYLGTTEVTVGQYRKFVEEAKYQGDPTDAWRGPGFPQTDDHPVVNVNWDDAMAFCAWLSQKEGRTYRLPTEAEWEYACRGGTNTRFWFGDDQEGHAAAANIADATAREQFPDWPATSKVKDGFVHTAPVGRFRPNPFGLHDMHGNVEEWCLDWFEWYFYPDSPLDDPQYTKKTDGRVVRGGAWNSSPRDSRSAHRGWHAPPERRVDNAGFRVVMVREEEKATEAAKVPRAPELDKLDRFQAGTIWRGKSIYQNLPVMPGPVNVELVVLKRDGNHFDGEERVQNRLLVRKIKGTMQGDSIRWDVVKVIKGPPSPGTRTGKISGDTIIFGGEHEYDGKIVSYAGSMKLVEE